MIIKSIAIDDEPLALRQIKSYSSKVENLELVNTFSNPIKALTYLEQNEVDLLFVDINMPDLTGLELVRSLKKRPFVVFTTAYSEYAVEGFRLDAVDYLLKPFSFEDFKHAVEKVRSLIELVNIAKQSDGVAQEAIPQDKEYITIKADYKTTLIKVSDIIYVESEGEYVRLHLTDGTSIMTLFRLKNMNSALPEEMFMRIHRSYIVNLKYVSGYVKGRVFLTNKCDLPIGELYRAEFHKYFEKNFSNLKLGK